MRNVHTNMQQVAQISDAKRRSESRLNMIRSSPKIYAIYMSA